MRARRLEIFLGNSISLRAGLITWSDACADSARKTSTGGLAKDIFGVGVREDVYVSKAQSTHVGSVAMTTR